MYSTMVCYQCMNCYISLSKALFLKLAKQVCVSINRPTNSSKNLVAEERI